MATKRIRNRNRKSKRRVRYLGGANGATTGAANGSTTGTDDNEPVFNMNNPNLTANAAGVRPLSPTGVEQIGFIQGLLELALTQAGQAPQNNGIPALIEALQAAQQAAAAAEAAHAMLGLSQQRSP